MTSIQTILIVEDCLELREDLAFELRDAGLNVVEASSGAEFWKRISNNRPDLVLCDVQLPDADGISLVQEMRAQKSNQSQPRVIFLSAFSDLELQNRAMQTGASAFLVKPVDYSELLSLIVNPPEAPHSVDSGR